MPALRFRPYWLAAGVLGLIAGMGIALAPSPEVLVATFSDKVLHATAFLFFMVWFSGLVEFRHAWRVAAGLLAYGALMEWLQSFTAVRLGDPLDFLADLVGVLLGWMLAAAGLRHWCSRVESWLAPEATPPSPTP